MKYLENLLLTSLAIFVPIKAAILTILVLIFVDLITGIWSALIHHEKITSSGLRRTISKLIIYEIGMCVGFIVEVYLLSNFLPVSKLIAGMIGVTELKSIFENLDSILGQSLFNVVIQKIGSVNQVEQEIRDSAKK